VTVPSDVSLPFKKNLKIPGHELLTVLLTPKLTPVLRRVILYAQSLGAA